MQLVLERGMVLVQPHHSPVGVTDTSKAGSKHREPKWHFSAQISKALVTAVGMEGRMQVSDWGICTCSIFWGACIQISLSLTGSGNYLFFRAYLFLVGKKPCYYMYVLNDVIWWNRGRWEAVKCVSTQHLCPGCMNRVFLLQSHFRLPFFPLSVPACWRHQLMPQVQLSFLSCTCYRQRQMETWNCWPQLLDHVGTFGFLQGSLILQNSPVRVSWYVTLEEASKYKWEFFAAVWRGSARHSTHGVSFTRLHSKKK